MEGVGVGGEGGSQSKRVAGSSPPLAFGSHLGMSWSGGRCYTPPIVGMAPLLPRLLGVVGEALVVQVVLVVAAVVVAFDLVVGGVPRM